MNFAFLVWPIVLVVSVVITGLIVLGDVFSPLRQLVMFWFLLVCPGVAFVLLLNIKDSLTRWILIIGASLAIDTAVATTMLYAGYWSLSGILLTLMAISIVGAGLQLKYANAAPHAPGHETRKRQAEVP
jgi:hypothetical protein